MKAEFDKCERFSCEIKRIFFLKTQNGFGVVVMAAWLRGMKERWLFFFFVPDQMSQATIE